MSILVVCDSRGRGLQQKLSNLGLSTTLSFTPGADLDQLYQITSKHIQKISQKNSFYTTIIFSGGICSITKLTHRKPNKIDIQYTSVDDLTSHFLQKLQTIQTDLLTQSPNSNVIINQVIGAHIMKHNKDFDLTHEKREKQQTLNTAMIKINQGIYALNLQINQKTPWTAGLVHRCKGNHRYLHVFKHLPDGVHFTDGLQMQIAKKISTAIHTTHS